MTRLKLAELTSGVGALLLGVGLGALLWPWSSASATLIVFAAQHVAKGTSGHGDHDKMMEEQGQMMMDRLKSASGSALDHAFLEQMAKHHEGPIAKLKARSFRILR